MSATCVIVISVAGISAFVGVAELAFWLGGVMARATARKECAAFARTFADCVELHYQMATGLQQSQMSTRTEQLHSQRAIRIVADAIEKMEIL